MRWCILSSPYQNHGSKVIQGTCSQISAFHKSTFHKKWEVLRMVFFESLNTCFLDTLSTNCWWFWDIFCAPVNDWNYEITCLFLHNIVVWWWGLVNKQYFLLTSVKQIGPVIKVTFLYEWSLFFQFLWRSHIEWWSLLSVDLVT